MLIRKRKNATLFILNQAFDSRVKMLNLANGLLFLFTGLFILNRVVASSHYSGSSWFMIFLALASFVCSYRFINKSLLSERLLINAKEIIFINKRLLKTSTTTYENNKISNFHFLEKKSMAPHPLAGKSMDYLGFQTTEVLINQLNGDKQLSFDYEGHTVLFGTDISEYEFEEIKSVLGRYCLPQSSESQKKL
jgi:hypothetical protein